LAQFRGALPARLGRIVRQMTNARCADAQSPRSSPPICARSHGQARAVALRVRSGIAVLIAGLLAHGAFAQDKPPDLTPAGKAILESKLAFDRPGSRNPLTFPLAMCAFPGGLCGAVRRDGSVAVPPRYDWVGPFSDNRAAVRLNGLYGFVDDDGREIVMP